MATRRQFIKFVGGSGFVLFAHGPAGLRRALAAIPGGTLDPGSVSKYLTSLLIPPVMPKAPSGQGKVGPGIDYYEIAFRQFAQQILPPLLPATNVWAYGPAKANRKSCRPHHARPFSHHRGDTGPAGPGQVDQRTGGRERQLPATSAAGGPDPALGQPARRHDGPRHATDLHLNTRALHGPGAHRHARPRCGRCRR